MPGEPGSRMDKEFCNDIKRIASALERIAEKLDPPSVFDPR